jgi:phenylacetate-coenzyme A ligase PaaK-like adenylate-forming protein
MSSERLFKLNKIWRYAYTNFDFYSNWKIKNNLPDTIKSLEDFNKWPIISRSDLQQIVFPSYTSFLPKSVSGGSTGKPLELPVHWFQRLTEKNTVTFHRNKLFHNNKKVKIILIWGHGHLFGKNIEYIYKKCKRFIFDRLYNYERISAYEINTNITEKLINKINKNKSNNIIIIGYSRLLYDLLINQEVCRLVIENNCKCILTAEGLLDFQKEKLFNIYKSNIVFEYGLAEFNAVAYKFQNESYEIFNDNIIAQINDLNELILTSIYSRYFPLIRYNTNDIVRIDENQNINYDLYRIKDIIGRTNDFIEIFDGILYKKIHSEYFSHVLKKFKNIKSYYIKQDKNKDLFFYLDAYEINKEEIINTLNMHFKITNKISILIETTNSFSNGKKKFIQIEE